MNSNPVSAEEALSCVQSRHRIYLHSMAATPPALVRGLVANAHRLRDVEIIQLHTEGPAPYTDEKYRDTFRVKALFVSPNMRDAVESGRADYVPIFLSEIPNLITNVLPVDVALVNVSPPDKHGFCSLGVSVEATRAAVLKASIVVAQINRRMPRVHGDGLIHISKIHHFVEEDAEIPEVKLAPPGQVEEKIGRFCADLIEDGATLQMGIGGIPNAVLKFLGGHKDLGIHTEMFSDGVIELVEKGVVNGTKKRVHPGKLVSTFLLGTRRLYDFVDDNPEVVLLDVAYVNDTSVIRRNQKVTAINSAIEIDLTGQICADSIGGRIYSGVGGQMDFIRGASLSVGGKPIIALPSVTTKGISRIVPYLKEGAGVVTTRAHAHYVVTEYGAAYIYGKSLRERARALIEIAHPDHREQLDREACERFHSLGC